MAARSARGGVTRWRGGGVLKVWFGRKGATDLEEPRRVRRTDG